MPMITRCPACETTFRVGSAQLQTHGGMVRCGRCMTVFDGFKTLSVEPELTVSDGPDEQPTPALAHIEPPLPVEAAEQGHGAEQAVESTAIEQNAPAFQLVPVSATELAAAAAAEPAAVEFDAGASETLDYGPAPRQLTLDEQLLREQQRVAAIRRQRWWGAGAVLMALALVAQAVFVFRGDIATYLPAARPALAGACARAGCTINLTQSPRQIAIEASDLQAVDAARPNLIVLTATVRNHASHDLGFPALDLVLTNTRDHTLARRIFQPREYLDPARDPHAGIPANAEVTIRLELDTADLNPAGFRLDLLAASPS